MYELIKSKRNNCCHRYYSWNYLIRIIAFKNVGILTDSHDINDECDNEANEKHQLSSKEILCILFPFEVNYYLDRLSLLDSCIFFSFLHQHYRRLSMYIHFQPLIIQLHQINHVVLNWKRIL